MLKEILSSYKNKHIGQKCFVLATGPSINNTDIFILNNCITFGCNTFYKHKFVAKYYCVCDEFVWNNHHKGIINKYKNPFCPFYNPINYKLRDIWLNQNCLDYGMITKGIYRAHTVVGCILQICFWMGFSKVFLLGCDCSYVEKQHHFDGSYVDNYKREDWTEVFQQYKIAKKMYEKAGRKIYNCTEGGKLEVFERMSLEKAISQ